jgi:diadenosine tetraphosphate (Ap4A) HIT family hydrolase
MSLDLDNARYPDQKAVMTKIIAAGESPFLPQNLAKYHPHPIIKQGKYWYITKNQWPYSHTLHHYLIIANKYWTKLEQITPTAMAEVITLAQWLQKKFSIPGGALALRFGDTNYSGGSVDHLHFQFIVPDLHDPKYEKIRFAIGKKRKKIDAKVLVQK